MEDKVNIGLSLEASKIADKIEETSFFEDRLSIAKFALAFAVKSGLDDKLIEFRIGEAGGTKWNVGSVDNDQYLRDLIVSLYPECETPYRYIEALMNKGLLKIGERINHEGLGRISSYMLLNSY